MKLLFKTYQDYPLPVKVNVDFTRQLGAVAKEDSFLSSELSQQRASSAAGRLC